jgi:hypothetical protein
MNSLMSITPKELRRAANIQEKINSLEAELDSLATEETEPVKVKHSVNYRIKRGVAPKGKRTLSAATRAKIAAAARARWAKARRAGRNKL